MAVYLVRGTYRRVQHVLPAVHCIGIAVYVMRIISRPHRVMPRIFK